MPEPAHALSRPPFRNYQFDSAYDEMFESPGVPRPHYRALFQTLLDLPPEELRKSQQAADLSFLHQGVTFTVYGNSEGTERVFPNDLLPRIIPNAEWRKIESGLTQRIAALVSHQSRFAIDDALETRQGVCQDFAHVMHALVRPLRIPCRYVSGYMFHRNEDEETKDRSLEGASHAWVEALVPNLGWIAFDPTNNLIGADRLIRVAFGRDYADVPPTRGVHKGEAHSELSVAVTVSPSDDPLPEE
jgi:hypothetical protein